MNPQVLVVDTDERRGAAVIQSLGARYECRLASTMSDALDALPRAPWFAVLVDFDFNPHFTGIEVLQEVREQDEGILRVLYSSSWSRALDREARRHAHAHAVLDAGVEEFPGTLSRALDEQRISASVPGGGAPGEGPDSPVAMWGAVAPATKKFLDDLLRAAESDTCPATPSVAR